MILDQTIDKHIQYYRSSIQRLREEGAACLQHKMEVTISMGEETTCFFNINLDVPGPLYSKCRELIKNLREGYMSLDKPEYSCWTKLQHYHFDPLRDRHTMKLQMCFDPAEAEINKKEIGSGGWRSRDPASIENG